MNGNGAVRQVRSDAVGRSSTPPADRRRDYFKGVKIHPSKRGPRSVLMRLIGGNRVHAETEENAADAEERTAKILQGQSPWITVVGDLGSGSLERLVNADQGEMFVVKHARFGPLAMGSIAYAVEHLGTGVLAVVRGDVMGGAEKAKEIAQALLAESETVRGVAEKGELTVVAAGICSKNGRIENVEYVQKGAGANQEKWEALVAKNHALAGIGVLNMPKKREAALSICPDSREVPTLIFQTPKIMSIRVAGNLVSQTTIGVFEELAKMGIPLLGVMGHEKCGAVKETINSALKGEMGSGEVGALINKAMPAVLRTKPSEKPEDHVELEEWLNSAIVENVKRGCQEIVESSPLINSKVGGGELAVVGMYHSLTTRKVDIVWAEGISMPTPDEIVLAHEARKHGNW